MLDDISFYTEVFYCYYFKKLYCMLPFIVHVIEMWSETVLLLSYYILGSTSFSCLRQCLLKLVRALENGLLAKRPF